MNDQNPEAIPLAPEAKLTEEERKQLDNTIDLAMEMLKAKQLHMEREIVKAYLIEAFETSKWIDDKLHDIFDLMKAPEAVAAMAMSQVEAQDIVDTISDTQILADTIGKFFVRTSILQIKINATPAIITPSTDIVI